MGVEDLKRGSNKDIGPKDIFEMGSNKERRNGLTGVLGRYRLGCEAESHHRIFSYPDGLDGKI